MTLQHSPHREIFSVKPRRQLTWTRQTFPVTFILIAFYFFILALASNIAPNLASTALREKVIKSQDIVSGVNRLRELNSESLERGSEMSDGSHPDSKSPMPLTESRHEGSPKARSSFSKPVFSEGDPPFLKARQINVGSQTEFYFYDPASQREGCTVTYHHRSCSYGLFFLFFLG